MTAYCKGYRPLLNAREHAVVALFVKGASVAEIAVALGIAPATVATHLANACKGLHVSGRHKLAYAYTPHIANGGQLL